MSSATPRQQVECVMEFMKDYEKARLPRDYIGAPPPLDMYQLHDDVPPGVPPPDDVPPGAPPPGWRSSQPDDDVPMGAPPPVWDWVRPQYTDTADEGGKTNLRARQRIQVDPNMGLFFDEDNENRVRKTRRTETAHGHFALQ